MESRAEIDAIKPLARPGEFAPSVDDQIIKRRPVYSIVLLALMTILVVAGSFNLYSASSGGDLFFVHMKHTCVGLAGFVVLALFVQPKHLNATTYWIYGAICAMLLTVLVVGHIGGGSRRWLNFGPMNIQPSELAKIAAALLAARFFSEMKQNTAYRLRDLWLLAMLVGFMSVMIFPQPDLGTASFLCLIVAAQICFVSIDWRSLAIAVSTGLVSLFIGWEFFLHPYQRDRVTSFLDPNFDPQGKGYNVQQSLTAIGSGGLYGKGFMNGTQTHLKFLPMSHSDFIFSVFSEEHGFIGGTVLILTFAALGCVALLIARQSKNNFSTLLAIGLGAFLFIEFAINVAMVLRMFPVKGLPLPFLSAGGSNLITSCMAIGILISIDRENRGRFRDRGITVYKS